MATDETDNSMITNVMLWNELKGLRQDMKDLHWRLLLQLSERMDEIQTEMKNFCQYVKVNSTNSKCGRFTNTSGNESQEIDICEENNTLWSDVNEYAQGANDIPVGNGNLEFEEIPVGSALDKNDMQTDQTNGPSVVLEVTTSLPDDDFSATAKSEGIHIENESTTQQNSNIRRLSKFLFDESTHIANCTDRHCLLCQSLCVGLKPSRNELKEERGQWKCTVCLKYFRRKYNLKNHMRCHTGEKPFQCNICQHYFRSKQALNYHFRKHDENYNVVNKLKQRMRNRNLQQPTVQDVILEADNNDDIEEMNSNATQNNTVLHFVTEDNVQNANYPTISTTKDLKPKLLSRLKEDERSWKCPVCENYFQRKANLKSHMRIHTGEKPFKCNICNRGFAAAYSLKVHKRIHSAKN